MQLDVSNPNIKWQTAIKHGNMLAKPACLVITDPLISRKMLLETLEGEERLGENVVICLGPFQDAWQQTASKMLAKYDITDITKDGWLVCNPKPGNSAWAIQVTRSMFPTPDLSDVSDSFFVSALWGKEVNGQYLQFGTVGDWVLRSQEKLNGVWIVKQKIFENTYKVVR